MVKINRVLILGMIVLSISGCSKKQVAKAAIVSPETSSETVIKSDFNPNKGADDFDTYEKPAESDFREADYMSVLKSWNSQDQIPAYSGEATITLNNDIPYFEDNEKTTKHYVVFSSLDDLGRCRRAMANICIETLPHQEKKEIPEDIKPSGWTSKGKIDDIEQPLVLCQLLGYECISDNSTKENFITGTQAMNQDLRLYERKIVEYVRETNNHVLYRITPLFHDNDMMAQGVELEIYSVEDNGSGLCYHKFIYNVQPGITIDYATGEYSNIE